MKQLVKTPEIVARLQKAAGADVAHDDLAVFEAIAINTLPMRKRHPIYKGAVATKKFLREMKAQLEAESLPLQIMHESWTLPKGRVFHAEVMSDGHGGAELRVQFWIAKTEAETIALIENGTIDQVSVGTLPKQILCSECGFDYLGKDADYENFYMGECNEGHRLGEKGVHAQLTTLDLWMELSLVGTGGAQNARIQSQKTARLSLTDDQKERLAASGVDPSGFVLNAIATKEAPAVDLKELVDKLTASEVAKATLEATKTTLEGQVTTLTTQVTELTAKIADLESKLANVDGAAALKAANDAKTALEAELAKIKPFLVDLAVKALTATGVAKPEAPDTIEAAMTTINESQAKLAALIIPGGSAQSAVADAKKPGVPAHLGAYSTRKK